MTCGNNTVEYAACVANATVSACLAVRPPAWFLNFTCVTGGACTYIPWSTSVSTQALDPLYQLADPNGGGSPTLFYFCTCVGPWHGPTCKLPGSVSPPPPPKPPPIPPSPPPLPVVGR
jgi:hypothetical protein